MKKLTAVLMALMMVILACSALADGGFTVQNVKFDTATLAKCAVLDGYTASATVNCCDETTCLGYPIRVSVTETNPDKDVFMFYYSGENFLDRVKNSSPLLQHEDGKLDIEFAMFMLRYMPAYNYTWQKARDILASRYGVTAMAGTSRDDLTSFGRLTEARTNYVYQNIVPGMAQYGMNMDWVEATAAERVFTFDNHGRTYCISVMSEVVAYQYSSTAFNTCNIIWDAPYYFVLVCPQDVYDEVHDNEYRIFRENTGTNDEFQTFRDTLTEMISAEVIRNWNMRCAYSMAYMETMTALTFSMVDSTLGGTYHNTDRFSDYIFDQNDYTTLDGDHVKVSTSYDYVFQVGGSVGFTNDALSIPTNAVMLTPN